jgi:hypothetical protein
MRLEEDKPCSQWPKSVQVEINNALRVALAIGSKMEDRISIKDLYEKTSSLTYKPLRV